MVSAIGRSTVEFSNGVTKSSGEELDVDIYMTSYQEQMLRLALQRHFETEKANFCNRNCKIKTLALFFIDDISSYRVGKDGKKPYLLAMFERLLEEQLKKTMASLNEHEAEYPGISGGESFRLKSLAMRGIFPRITVIRTRRSQKKWT